MRLLHPRKLTAILFFAFFITFQGFTQHLSYSHLSADSESLYQYLRNDDNYFAGGNETYPYFRGKESGIYIKFHKLPLVTVVMEFTSQDQYWEAIQIIRRNTTFKYKYNTSYNQPVVYNYLTNSGNNIRFNNSEYRISIDYPSEARSLLDENIDILPVFVCTGETAYAYHTNLRCEGLGNCEGSIAKTDIGGAEGYGFRICEICTSDNL